MIHYTLSLEKKESNLSVSLVRKSVDCVICLLEWSDERVQTARENESGGEDKEGAWNVRVLFVHHRQQYYLATMNNSSFRRKNSSNRIAASNRSKVRRRHTISPSSLHVATVNGHAESVKLLLSKRVSGGCDDAAVFVDAINTEGVTPLYVAARNGFTAIVGLLLDQGADVDFRDADGETPLYVATHNGFVDVVVSLLDRGATVDICDTDGVTPLSIACEKGHFKIAEALLERGANAGISDTDGDAPLYVASQNGFAAIVELLLKRGREDADVDQANADGVNALFIAAQNGFSEVVELLLECGDANVDFADAEGVTPLSIGSHNGHLDVVRVLLDHRANVDSQDADGETALHFAADNGHSQIVAALLERGANVDTAGSNGATALCIAAQNGHFDVVEVLLDCNASIDTPDADGDTALSVAAQHGFADVVEILLDRGATVDFPDADGATPLYVASQNGHAAVVKLLLEMGAEVDFAEGDGSTPLYAAAYNGHSEVVERLIAHGANADFIAEVGVTPLYAAAYNGYSQIAKILLDRGVDVDSTTAVGVTPLYIASQNGFAGVVSVLLDGGANANLAVPLGATPLYIAAQYGYLDVVNKLLDGGATVDFADADGATPLYISSQNGHSDVATALLNRGAKVDLAAPDGATPLYIAAQSGHALVVTTLLHRGATVNFTASNGATPLYIAAHNGHLNIAALLLEAGANVNHATPNQTTPLHAASQNGHVDIVELLLQRGADVEFTDANGDSPLLVASREGHAGVAKVLLDRFATVDLGNHASITPLYIAAQTDRLNVVSLLLDFGARVNRTAEDGTTPLYAAAYYGHLDVLKLLLDEGAAADFNGGDSSTPLYAAAHSGQSEVVGVLLDHGAEMDFAAPNGTTPLGIACHNGHCNVVKVLLDRGASVDFAAQGFPAPLYIASQNGSTDIAAELIRCGANVNLAGPRESPPLLVASTFGHLDLVHLLLDCGVALNAKDFEGNTPLICASKNGHVGIVEGLLQKGAAVDLRNGNDETALLAAGSAGHFDVLRTLIDAGASGHVRSANGETPLISAARWGNVDTVMLLFEHGCFSAARGAAVEAPLLSATLQTLRGYGSELHEFEGMWVSVVTRLEEIHAYFDEEEPVQSVLQHFVMLIFRVLKIHQVCKKTNIFTRLVISANISSSIQDFHTEIDHLLRRIARNPIAPSDWGTTSDTEIFSDIFPNDEQLFSNLKDEADQIEAIALLQHEICAHGDKYSQGKLALLECCLDRILSISDVEAPPTPPWFVPRHEISIEDSEITMHDQITGSYLGKWMNSTVMIREYEASSKHDFAADTERWFQLSYPHVAKLFGSYHLRRPHFAVFENASSTSLREFLAADGNHRLTWQKLFEAALGLKYLHERSIVLGKLLSENIWIGTDGLAKINGFGLDVYSEQSTEGLDSVRWKAPEVVRGEPPSFASDVYSLGMCIVEAVTGVAPWGDESCEQVRSFVKWGFRPPRPASMSTAQWRLIQCMCIYDPVKRLKLVNVLEHLKYFASQEYESVKAPNLDSPVPERAMPNAAGDIIPQLGSSTEIFLSRLRSKCLVCRSCRESVLYVHARLVDINAHLKEMHKLPTDVAVIRYHEVLLSFDSFLRTAVSEASVDQQARSQEVSLKGHVHHREIDELLELLKINAKSGSIHDWQQKEARTAFKRLQRSDTADSERLNSGLTGAPGAVTLRHFEAKHQKHTLNPPVNFGTFDRRIREFSQPPWFIPMHELKFRREDYITAGSFGAVYRGHWLGTPVVVKLMGYEEEATGLDLFLHELRVWYQLNHPHVIKLFGACHVGKRFFVCEYAANGTLCEYLHQEEETNRRATWQKLYEVGLGLQYLHEQNIVHNDLKCDNFLVGSDAKAKITDFGLSCIPNTAEIRIDLKQQGAQQWKSPEHLRGERPTLASDVYSFGMCILEAVTGSTPWGSMADVVVRLQLRKGHLPPRPASMSDDQWDLIEMTSAHDPSHRFKVSSVVERLHEFAQQEETSKTPRKPNSPP